MGTSMELPRSAVLALWLTAWRNHRTSLDDARDAIHGTEAAHDVAGVPGEEGPVPLIVALGLLRSAGASGAGVALPVPGDPLGLAGPQGFNTAALDAGEAVVLAGVDLGLVPRQVGAGVVWTVHEAVSARQVPDPSEADTTLRQALLAAAGTLADLDVARWRPEVADELMNLRHGVDLELPPGIAPRTQRLAATSVRCRRIVELALEDDGGAVSTYEAVRRRDALAPLDHAARRGLVAACDHPWER